jgi:Domain of unknown function (DUF334)
VDFDFSKVLTPAIAIVAPIAVLAIRRPISKVENRTKQLQYWKTYIELTNLAGREVTDEEKRRCAVELAEADNEAQNLNNKLLSFVAGILTIAIIFALMTLIGKAFTLTINMARQQFQRSEMQFRDRSEQYGFLSLVFQIAIGFAYWIWVRWWIRDYLWNRSRTGQMFSFVRTSGTVKSAITEIVLGVLLLPWVFLWLSVEMPTQLQH